LQTSSASPVQRDPMIAHLDPAPVILLH